MSHYEQRPAGSGWPELGAMIADRYRLGERIGEGGMAAVYLATRADDGVEVALKVLRPELAVDPEVVRRFLQEARAASLIRHPNIVGILDFGFTGDGVAFLVMERLVGDDLADVLGRDGPLPWERLAPLMIDACAALGAAHAQGIVHRDVKPENCFLIAGPDGQPQVKVLDFGIAKDIGGSLPDRPQTATGMLCGSPEYIAPEVIMGKVAEVGSDVYALGITMYELLCGSHPFVGAEFGEMLAAHVQRPVPTFASRGVEAPPGVEALVLRCLAKHPDERPADMKALAVAIRTTLQRGSLSAAPPRGPLRRRPQIALMVGLVVLLLGAAGAAAWWWSGGVSDRGDATALASARDAGSGSTGASGSGGSTTAAGEDPEGETSSGGEGATTEGETEGSGSESDGGSEDSGGTGDGEVSPESGDEAARTPLSKARARRVIDRKIATRAKKCLREHTSLVRGQRFTVKVVISPEGVAKATATLLPKSPAARCIAALFKKTSFPASSDGAAFSHSFSP